MFSLKLALRLLGLRAMRPGMLRMVPAVALAAAATVASAQILECIDARGNKEYTRHCPAGTVKERQIWKGAQDDEDAAPAASPPSSQKSSEEQDVGFRKRLLERQEADAKAAKEKADADEAARNCNDARGQLISLETGQRISGVDPGTGERAFLGDEERPEAIVRARKTVEQWCKR